MARSWLEVLDETARVCAAHGRNDLIQLLAQKRAQLLDPKLRVLVIGEPKQGKSQLINALLNATVCPAGDGTSTSVPVVVQHADQPSAVLVGNPRPAIGRTDGAAGDTPDRTPVPIEQVAPVITGNAGWPGARPMHVEIGLPREILAAGLVLIDTPPADGLGPVRAASPVAALARADLVLMVSDVTRALSVTELNLILQVVQSHPSVIVIQTKIDLVPHWRDVVEHNRQHLAGAGVPATLIPVSAALRLQAARTNDKAINAESRFPDLIARLGRELETKGDVLARASAGLVARTVTEQLAAPLRAELSTQGEDKNSRAIGRLHEAQREVDELRRCSSRWQNTLNDEMADIMSDIEYDLRDRTRQILKKVDEAFDTADPLVGWEEFQDWLAGNLAEAADANYMWLAERCEWAAMRVANNFARYGAQVFPNWHLDAPDDLTGRLPAIEQPPVERFTVTQKLVSGLRGSYGGLLMFGLVTTLAGMPLLNPISIGAGALLGGKTVRDESKSLLKRRQAAVKVATQRHVDDFFLTLSKERKDLVRRVQRMLRDHFTSLTEELQEEIVQSFRSAKQAADADKAERDQRHRKIMQEMQRLALLYEQAKELTVAVGGPNRVSVGQAE